jgi:hypothetical protein
MAIDVWFNATADKNAANKPDPGDHVNIVTHSNADALDLTLCWDSAVVTSLATWDSLVADIRRQTIAHGFLTT